VSYRIAYSTNAYTKWPLDRAIADIRARGFDGVEILADEPHAFPPSDPAAIRAALGGFPVSNLNGNTYRRAFRPSLIDPDAGRRRERVAYVKGVIDLARAIGAATVCASSGVLEGGSKAMARELFLNSLELILAHAEPDVRVGIEYEPGFFVGDMPALSKILEEMDHPLLGVNLDVGHAVCVWEKLEDVVEVFAGRIWNLHVEDIRGREHVHLVPGRGSIRFEKLRSALDRARYAGFLTLEIYPYVDTPGESGSEGLAFLRRVFG
jgi:sugar phosphate isomerase/epimerase